MCYETALTKEKKQIERKYNVQFAVPLEYEPYYHKSAFGFPNLQIIKMDEPQSIYPSTWGFVPEWSMKEIDTFRKKYNTFNARSEKILTSGTFKESAMNKRCLIISDGFFEPHHINNISIPNFCYIPTKEYDDNRDIFLFAGLYSEIDSNAFSCTILTTDANPFFAEVHNKKKRMPLVLDEDLTEDWLSPNHNEKTLTDLMKHGFTSKEFKAHPVSRDLYKKNIDTNKAYIIDPVDKETLF